MNQGGNVNGCQIVNHALFKNVWIVYHGLHTKILLSNKQMVNKGYLSKNI